MPSKTAKQLHKCFLTHELHLSGAGHRRKWQINDGLLLRNEGQSRWFFEGLCNIFFFNCFASRACSHGHTGRLPFHPIYLLIKSNWGEKRNVITADNKWSCTARLWASVTIFSKREFVSLPVIRVRGIHLQSFRITDETPPHFFLGALLVAI